MFRTIVNFLRAPSALVYLTAVVLLAWGAGLHVSGLAKVVVFAGLGALLFARCRASSELGLLGNRRLHQIFVVTWVLLLLVYQVAEVLLGLQGIDFAIFSQTIESFATDWTFNSVLLGAGSKSFLTHHFSPILAVPGLIAKLGLPGHYAGIVFHVIAVAAALFLFFKFARALCLEEAVAWFLLVLMCCNPSLRVGLFWEVHDECFGIPFVVAAYLAWALKRHFLAAVALFLCMLCKETYFFFAVFFFAFVILWEYCYGNKNWRVLWPYLMAAVIGLIGIAVYVVWPLAFWDKTFAPTTRISNWSEFFTWSALSGKFSFLLKLLVPMLFVPFWTKRGLLASIPALAFLGPIMLSNFENMYFPYNYYSVVPSVILMCAALVSLQRLEFARMSMLSPAWYAILIALPLTAAGPVRPLRTINSLAHKPMLNASQLALVPREAVVVAQDYDILYLQGVKQIYRAWTAERLDLPWQYLIIRKTAQEPFPQKLLDQSEVCGESSNWIFRCRIGVKLSGKI